MSAEKVSPELELTVAEALVDDVGQGLARISKDDGLFIKVVPGDLIEISGQSATVARVAAGVPADYDKKIINIDDLTRKNAGLSIGQKAKIKRLRRETATSIILMQLDAEDSVPSERDIEQFAKILQGSALTAGDTINMPYFGGKDRLFKVVATAPPCPVIINLNTQVVVQQPDFVVAEATRVSYEQIGGLERELKLVREMVELPLRHEELFTQLGIEAPKGVLLYGPPGTGKTLIARAIAAEAKLHFIKINGPEIIHKFYGESEARLREIFEDAIRKAPSVIFIDEIDAIAPRRANVLGDVEKRVVAQLLALMDGVIRRGRVVVIGATNIPEMIDPALRRPGRFDREIVIPVPNAQGRHTILKIHSRRMPLAPDVDLEHLAQITYGFVGADVEALCKEAGMVTLRRHVQLYSKDKMDTILQDTTNMKVTMDDFLTALVEVEPSATREFFTERSTLRWANVGGLDNIKETLISIVDWPYKYPELFAAGKLSPSRGILFSGLSGTGKTLMAKALAGETGLNFISISGPTLFSKWLGESEKTLHEIFKKAKQSAPCILFFDEIDALIPKRGDSSNEGGISDRVTSQFFSELDNMGDHSQVLILGATNRLNSLDPTLLRAGRLDYHIEFPIPTWKERLEIFNVHMAGKPISPDVDARELVNEMDEMVGSQIALICKRATLIAISEVIHSTKGDKPKKKLLLTRAHFIKAIEEIVKKHESEQ
jgi:transitional endoplasmic reticulum ATPase